MGNIRFTIAAIAVAAASSATLAGTVKVQANPGAPWQRSSTDGGGFRATQIAGQNGLMGGRGGTATSFITFCLERNEFLSGNNATYTTVIAASAAQGGMGGSVPDGDGGHHDPISAITAALYREFRSGGTYGGLVTAGLDASSWGTSYTDALQLAIWNEEEELNTTNLQNQFANNALAVAMYDWAAAHVANNFLGQYDIGNVRVLRLYNADGSHSQDLLTMIPLPSAAGLAFVGLAAVRVGSGRRRL